MDALSLDVFPPEIVGARLRLSRDGRWRVPEEAVRVPVWSADGRTLFYDVTGAMMGVPVTTDPSFAFGEPEVVIEGDYVIATGGAGFSVTRGYIVEGSGPTPRACAALPG